MRPMAEGDVLWGRGRELVLQTLHVARRHGTAHARVAERVELVRVVECSGVVVGRVGSGGEDGAPGDEGAVAEGEVLHRLAAHDD